MHFACLRCLLTVFLFFDSDLFLLCVLFEYLLLARLQHAVGIVVTDVVVVTVVVQLLSAHSAH